MSRFPAILCASLLLATASTLPASAHSSIEPTAAVTVTRSGAHALDGRFSLIDQDGERVSDTNFRGAPMLVYFGYTACADACPLDAQRITQVVDVLEGRGIRIAPIFISVDPERDQPARLKAFLANFHPRFTGLTGIPADVHKIVLAYGSDDTKVNVKGPESYDIEHPALAYLMNKDGKFVELVPLRATADSIATEIAAALQAQR